MILYYCTQDGLILTMDNNTESVLQLNTSSNTSRANCISQEDYGLGFYWTKFLVDILLVTILVVFGLIGNGLSFCVLSNLKGWTTYFLLKTLAVVDSLYLILCLFFLTFKTMYTFQSWFSRWFTVLPYLDLVVWPVASICQTLTVWLVVLITVDRFLNVCYPMEPVFTFTNKKAKISVVILIVASTAFNLPTFFDLRIIDRQDSCPDIHNIEAIPSGLLMESLYQLFYKTIMVFLVRSGGPFLVLLVLNVKLWLAANRSIKYHAKLCGRQSQHKETPNMLVIVVVVIFLICALPDIIFRILRTVKTYQPQFPMSWKAIAFLSIFSNLFLTVNSSVNFIIYILTGKSFQEKLVMLFPINTCRGRMKSVSSSQQTTLEMETSLTKTFLE